MCPDGRATRGIASDLASEGWARLAGGEWAAASCAPAWRWWAIGVEALEMTHRHYVERAAGPQAYLELFKQTFRPVVGIHATLAGEPERVAALDRDFLEFATRANSGPPQGPADCRYEYLLVVVRRPAL